jgi:hypothetical protein
MDEFYEIPSLESGSADISENVPTDFESINAAGSTEANNSRPDGASPEGRRKLLENGFEPLLLSGKVPVMDGWTKGDITPERLKKWEARWGSFASNTGLRTGRLVMADIDLWNSEDTEVISDVIQKNLGSTDFERVGQKGKGLLYFNTEPIRKITITGIAPGDNSRNTLVEFFGEGGQIAAFGIHPNTKEPYTWKGVDPLTYSLDDLPKVTSTTIRVAAAKVFDALRERGYTDLKLTGDIGREGRTGRPNSGDPVTPAMLENMLAHVDPDCEMNTWISYMCGIKYAPLFDFETMGPAEDFDRFDLFLRWSSGELNPDHAPHNFQGADDCLHHWDSKNDTDARTFDGAGLGSIIHAAREGGYTGEILVPLIERLRGKAKIYPEANDNREETVAEVAAAEIPNDIALTENRWRDLMYRGEAIAKIKPPVPIIPGYLLSKGVTAALAN